MKITNCKIKKETIVYEVLTSGNQPFTYELPKDYFSEFISDSLEIENKLNKIDRNINNIVSAIDKVKKLKGNSYACINSFQPISKFRIRKVLPPKIKNPVIDSSDIMLLINRINNNILQIPDIR